MNPLSADKTRCCDATCRERHTCERFLQLERDKQDGQKYSYVVTLRGDGVCRFRIAVEAK